MHLFGVLHLEMLRGIYLLVVSIALFLKEEATARGKVCSCCQLHRVLCLLFQPIEEEGLSPNSRISEQFITVTAQPYQG